MSELTPSQQKCLDLSRFLTLFQVEQFDTDQLQRLHLALCSRGQKCFISVDVLTNIKVQTWVCDIRPSNVNIDTNYLMKNLRNVGNPLQS